MAALPVAARFIGCPHCGGPIEIELVPDGPQQCPRCRGAFEAACFPAVAAARPEPTPAAGLQDGTTPCGLHAHNAALANCARCGIFICSVCRIDVDRRVLCPPCFERLATEGGLDSVVRRFPDYASLSGVLALGGLFVFFLAPALGPAAIYFAYRAHRQRSELGQAGSRVGLYALATVGALEAVAGAALLVFLVNR